ncbi:MAG TPA: hypothetical protein VFG04_06490 [Planctomycetaceae bacterium]|jgi:hypothetical protein|nr:hypothetical protein [Planctomycetaceae bacterium]
MKSLYALAAIVAFSAVPAFAAEGQVSHNALAKMGLSSMKSMDDAQGMKIRGTSIAIASGTSFAVQFGGGGAAGSVNTSTGVGHHSASQNNFSVAGQTEIVTVGPFVATATHVIGAGGASSAHAH